MILELATLSWSGFLGFDTM